MRGRQAGTMLALVLGIATFAGAAWAQETSGEARIAGKVLDAQKKPVQDVVVRAKLGAAAPRQAKTNNKGEWSINNLAGGMWEIEFGKEGFGTQRITLDLKPDQRIPNIDIILEPPPADPNAEIQAEVKRAGELFQNKQVAEGRKIYENLLAKYPTIHQLNEFIGRTYAAEGNFDKAIEYVRIAVEKDPANIGAQVFLGDLLMEKGDKAEAQKVLDAIDLDQNRGPGAIRQPRDHQDQRPEGRRSDRPAREAHGAVPERNEPLLLPRPCLSRRQEAAGSQGGSREVRGVGDAGRA